MSYKDGVMSDDTFSFLTMQTEKPIIVKRVTIGQIHGIVYPFELGGTAQNVYFLEFSGRYDGSSRFVFRQSLGPLPSLSLPVMTLLPVPTTSSNGACLFHS